jgi:prenyltransferase beta subunit
MVCITVCYSNISFKASTVTIEYDIRFVYAACCISYLIEDFSGINIEKASNYIESCQNGDYGFGFTINSESHGKVKIFEIINSCFYLFSNCKFNFDGSREKTKE